MIMCRDLYGCRPSELAEEDPIKLLDHLALYNEEQRITKLKSKVGSGAPADRSGGRQRKFFGR